MPAQVVEGQTALDEFSKTVGIEHVGGLGGGDFGGGGFFHGGDCPGGSGAGFGSGWRSLSCSHRWTITVSGNSRDDS